MWDLDFLINETPIFFFAKWPDGVRSTGTSAMWDWGSLTNEIPIAPSGQMVCTVETLLLCGMWALLSM